MCINIYDSSICQGIWVLKKKIAEQFSGCCSHHNSACMLTFCFFLVLYGLAMCFWMLLDGVCILYVVFGLMEVLPWVKEVVFHVQEWVKGRVPWSRCDLVKREGHHSKRKVLFHTVSLSWWVCHPAVIDTIHLILRLYILAWKKMWLSILFLCVLIITDSC